MREYALLGKNIGYSLSPKLHRYLFKKFNIDASYVILDIDNIAKEISQNRHLSGFNITKPYKEEIKKYINEFDDLTKKIGAVNTVSIKDSKLFGYNTDYYGFKSAYLKYINKTDKILLIGAGGAAKAIYYALTDVGFDVCVTNRTIDKIKIFSNKYITLKDANEGLRDYDVIINATSFSDNINSPVKCENLGSKGVLIDIVYSPLETKLMQEAKNKGLYTINGLRMLIYQAIRAYSIWLDENYELSEEEVLALEEYLINK